MSVTPAVESFRRCVKRPGELGERERERMRTWSGVIMPEKPPEPRWATPGVEIPLGQTLCLRVVGEPIQGQAPVLIVTPQVNHSYIADFHQDQSLVRTMRGAGFACVGVTDWKEPPRDLAYRIADSIDDILSAMERLGERVHLVGLCQGGWQSAIVAALHPERVASLTLAAAPIDTWLGATLLHAYTLGLPLAFFEAMVSLNGGVMPGKAFSLGFDNLRAFERLVYNPSSLYFQAENKAFVDRFADLRSWYQLHKGVAGELYIEVVRDLFQKNLLARGLLEIRGEKVDLSCIEGPVHLLAGTRDHITPEEQLFALKPLAPRAQVSCHRVEAGHIGVFMGRSALTSVWPKIAAEMNSVTGALGDDLVQDPA